MCNIYENLLDTIHGHRCSGPSSGKCNVYPFIADFLTMKMCYSLAGFIHTWHAHKTDACVVWQHLHPDVQYLVTTSIQSKHVDGVGKRDKTHHTSTLGFNWPFFQLLQDCCDSTFYTKNALHVEQPTASKPLKDI